MRGIVVLVLVLLVASTSTAAGARRSLEGSCPANQITVFFWPSGHGAIAAIQAPVFRVPHVEVAGLTYGVAEYLQPTRAGFYLLRSACDRRVLTRTFTVLPSRTIRTAATVTCSVPSKTVRVQAVELAGGADRIRVLDSPKRLLVAATLVRPGSSLSYSTRLCRMSAPPG
jgi:hypothetical protein